MIPSLWYWWFEDFSLCFSLPHNELMCIPGHVSTCWGTWPTCLSSVTTVACNPSFAIFRAVSTIFKSASPGRIVTWWPFFGAQAPASEWIALCSCCWLETLIAYIELHSVIEIQPLWNLAYFFFDVPRLSYQIYTHQRQSNILFHNSCQDKKCTASKLLHILQERSSKLCKVTTNWRAPYKPKVLLFTGCSRLRQ